MPDDVRPPVATSPPAAISQSAISFGQFSIAHLPLSLQIFFNPELNSQCVRVATWLSKAEGFTPPHLLGKLEACFAVVSRSLTWRLDPYAVACATYQTPGTDRNPGRVGYYGSLCQAILENSGQLEGGISFEYYGDWDAIRGKFKIAKSSNGKDYPVSDWKSEDEIGLGVTVSAQLKGEALPRSLRFDLGQAYPRFSTLWATDPQTQIKYTAVRRFGNSVVPALFMGVPFDREEYGDWASTLRDITPPRPELVEYGSSGQTNPRPARRRQPVPEEVDEPIEQHPAARQTEADTQQAAESSTPGSAKFFFSDADGVVHEYDNPASAVVDYSEMLGTAAKAGEKPLAAAWENSGRLLHDLRASGHETAAEALHQEYYRLLAEIEVRATRQTAKPQEQKLAPEATPYDVLVPLGTLTAKGWCPLAQARIKAMVDEKRPADDFKRFRTENAQPLALLLDELPNWHRIVDKTLTDNGG